MHHRVLHRQKRGYQGTNEKFSIVGLCKAIWDGKWALATPAIILGGIYWGVFTPTETPKWAYSGRCSSACSFTAS